MSNCQTIGINPLMLEITNTIPEILKRRNLNGFIQSFPCAIFHEDVFICGNTCNGSCGKCNLNFYIGITNNDNPDWKVMFERNGEQLSTVRAFYKEFQRDLNQPNKNLSRNSNFALKALFEVLCTACLLIKDRIIIMSTLLLMVYFHRFGLDLRLICHCPD
ncbi:hypothetical protein LIER_26106 [Lithospermum erythrorhizon]|uniref:Uncharacterized protein n=1 Tax=Lithospermum erythrorhizon TaxID=34254 RepID=A0AAV3RAW8_LITER